MNLQLIKTFSFIFLLAFAKVPALKAQDGDTLTTRPIQVSFVTPLGTNGTNSGQTINNFSYNILYGASAGVKGMELAGLANKTNGQLIGGQFSGLGNFVTGKVRGAQVAGLINTSSTLNGFQSAGLINISREEKAAASEGSLVSHGWQTSGIGNINSGSLKGLQAAGIFNINSDSLQGTQIAGIVNNSRHIRGAQMSGILNKTKTLSGVQIGLINIADSIESGVQIGLLNFTKNGYRAIEIESSESFYASASFKMGTERLYTIFSASYKEQDGKNIWAPGFGIGTYFPVGEKVAINIDAINYQVNEDEWWTEKLNHLNKLKVNGSYQIARNFSIYGGVSLNVMVSKLKASDEDGGGSIFETPNSFYDETHKNTRVIIYPGFNAGFRF